MFASAARLMSDKIQHRELVKICRVKLQTNWERTPRNDSLEMNLQSACWATNNLFDCSVSVLRVDRLMEHCCELLGVLGATCSWFISGRVICQLIRKCSVVKGDIPQ